MKVFNERRNLAHKLIFLAFITVVASVLLCCCVKNSVTSQIVIESTSQESEVLVECEFTESRFSSESDIEIESDVETESDFESVLEESQEESEIPVAYSVIFLIDGVEHLSESVIDGNLLSKPTDPVKDGFVFLGWYCEDELFDFSLPISENLVLVAKWHEVFYSVTFMSNSDSEILPQNIKENGFVIKPNDPQKEGFEFLGWYLNGEIFDFSSPICQNLELVAMWQAIVPPTVIVTFDTNGGAYAENKVIDKNSCVTKPNDPIKEGFVFIGWYLKDELFDFATVINEDIVLVAMWEQLKPIEDLVGTWRGCVSSNTNEERVLQIVSSNAGALQINRLGISHTITYSVKQVTYYANVVIICYEHNGVLHDLHFEFNGENLVCKDVILDEELILSKEYVN